MGLVFLHKETPEFALLPVHSQIRGYVSTQQNKATYKPREEASD